MSWKTILAVVGVVLVIVQLVSVVSVVNADIGLFPSNDDYYQTSSFVEESNLNLKSAWYGVVAGSDRFLSSFKETYDDRVEDPQLVSCLIRESLGCSGDGSFGLIVYDIILFISYSFLGLLGAGLFIGLFISSRVDKRNYAKMMNDMMKSACEKPEDGEAFTG